ncbi:MAG: ureidoglycolate hydrolase [Candidatus Krumholzibacteriia bacterium]|jgi:ureidoglycolate hydrolase
MPIDPALLEVHAYTEPGFRPLVDFDTWRVAVLNYCADLSVENLHNMQRHDETDEVFVLLKGRCVLFLGDGKDEAGRIQAIDLKPQTVYNVTRGTWHNHTLSEDASVLVIENRNTTTDNSPFTILNTAQRAKLTTHTQRLWGS